MSIVIEAITFDCAEPRRLAGFWAAVTGYQEDATQTTVTFGGSKCQGRSESVPVGRSKTARLNGAR